MTQLCVARPPCIPARKGLRESWTSNGLIRAIDRLEPGSRRLASFLSGISARCVQAGRASGELVIGDMSVTVVVRSVPGLSLRCGARMARPVRTNALTKPEDPVERLS
jgi:hypothetical protein